MPLSFFCRKVCVFVKNEKEKKTTVAVTKFTMALIFCLCIVLAAAAVLGACKVYQMQKKYGSLAQLEHAVDQTYYKDVDENAVMESAMKGYVAGLDDPYSQYMTSDEYAAYQTSEAGQTIGIGVTVSQTEEGYLEIQDVNTDSPAKEAGLQKDDLIIKVDGDDVAEMGYEGAVNAVRGDPDTKVTLTIKRGDETFDQDVTRKSMEVTSAEGKMLDGKIGYITIRSFKENTPDQFQAIYDQLIADGAEALVFDLRDDGGGLVSALEKILDPLLPEGKIAIATYRDGTTETLVESDATECNLPMAVVVNENTASAAELFTASLQDFGKGTVVGTTTFGKGIMQVTRQMPSGGALTLTTATYQTTKGECYHGIGVKPDVEVEAGDTAIDYENPNPDTDPQLKKAIEIVTEQMAS